MSGPHKKGGHEEGGGHAPMWIVSFADLVILLMSFFVLLLAQGSQKTTSDEDILRILASVKANFGYVPRPDSKDALDIAVMQVLSQSRGGGFTSSGQRWKSAAVKGEARKERDKWVKSQSPIGKPVFFEQGSSRLTGDWKANLEEVAENIRHHYKEVIIQGHCSPDEAAQDPLGGDELTFRRALAVKRALKDLGIAAKKLRPVPLSSNCMPSTLSPEDRQLAVVSMGSYLLPSGGDVLDDPRFLPKEDADSKTSSHGGH